MGNSSSNSNLVNELSSNSKFSKKELRRVFDKFSTKYPNNKMTKTEFIEEMTQMGGQKELWLSIYSFFDSKKQGFISPKSFMVGLNLLQSSEPKQLLKSSFNLFDADANGELDTTEVADLLAQLFTLTDSFSKKKALSVDDLVKAMDADNDGVVSMEEFVSFCENEGDLFEKISECTKAKFLTALDVQASKTSEFSHQAGGHTGDEKGMKKQGNNILKHFSDKEFQFYEDLKEYPKYQKYFPKYSGRTQVKNSAGGLDHFIILEDLTHGFEKPCIMDLKMGSRTYENGASVTKRLIQGALDEMSTSFVSGFRIVGIRTWQVTAKDYVVKGKDWGVSVNTKGLGDAIKVYFNNGKEFRRDVVKAIIPEVEEILAWFRKQKVFEFFGSSVLMVYEGDTSKPCKVNVRLVDFAHTNKTTKHDEGYIHGLETLQSILRALGDDDGKEALNKNITTHVIKKALSTAASQK